ncbi:unnamed protein product, partial [Porites evermanni]
DTRTAPTDPVTELTLNPVQSSNVFDEEVADIAQVHCDSELFEFELSTSPPCVNVKGNLRRNFEFWKHIRAPSFILNVIERGFLLPFVSFPEPAVFKNNRSSLSHAEFVEEAIQGLVESGRVVETNCYVPPRVAGFVTNEDKSMWIPRQKLDWLGITWDSARGTIEIVDRRVAKITCTIDSIMDSDFVLSARRLASFTGQIISTAPVSGNISRIMTRHCIMSTLSAQHWDAKVKMDSYCIEELYFWRNNLNSIKVRDCFPFNKPQRFAYSDASATGCGSVITRNEDCVCHKL